MFIICLTPPSTDVIKAVALGAQAVAVGRPILWGLTMDGAQGVEQVLDIFRIEIDLALGLCGASNLSEVNSDLIF